MNVHRLFPFFTAGSDYTDRRADVAVRCGDTARAFKLKVREESDRAAAADLARELRLYDCAPRFPRPLRAVTIKIAVGEAPTATLVVNLPDAGTDADAVQAVADALCDLARPHSFKEPGVSAREMFERSVALDPADFEDGVTAGWETL